MMKKNVKIGAFDKLPKNKQLFVQLVFEGNLKNIEIAHQVGLKRDATVSEWKKKEWFKPAFDDYASKLIKSKYKSQAMNTMFILLNAKSEMVRLQAATNILKLAGMFSDNSTPELDKAKTRKANADARVAEAKAKAMEDNGTDVELLLDKMMDTLTKEGKKNGNN